jgi:hypothetical protein
MKDIELISQSTIHSVSFVCSFGYKVVDVIRRKNRLNDFFTLKNIDDWSVHAVTRKDFFSFIRSRHGGVKMTNNPVGLDPLKDIY